MRPTYVRPAVNCPKCGAPPRLSFSAQMVKHAASMPPDAPLGTYQCHRILHGNQRCDTIYPVPARAILGRAA